MIGLSVLGGLFLAHVLALCAGFLGPGVRVCAGLLVIAGNYPLRRLLFLDPALGAQSGAWYGMILLGDLTLGLLVAMSAFQPAARRWQAADGAVLLLAGLSILLALTDPRTPPVVRAAHWKEEYWPLTAYALVRLNGPAATARLGPFLWLAGAGAAVALWQAVAGPTALDLAWIASGHSVLARDGGEAITGAHGLGNLEGGAAADGWIRPWGLFGNGSDLGGVLTVAGLLSVAAAIGRGKPLATAVRRPFPLVMLAGIAVSAVRFSWSLAALGGLFLALGLAPPGVPRLLRALVLGGTLAAATAAFLLLAPQVGDSATLAGRAFVLGTWQDRMQTQAAALERFADQPARWLLGEGFGAGGAAAAKFAADPLPEAHSRLIDLLRDGGLPLALLWLAPPVAALLGGRAGGGDAWRAAGLAFPWALLITATVLGGKSALLGGLMWACLGLAVNRRGPPCA